MANTLNLGDGNWGVKDSSLLGYAKDNTKFVPETFDVTRASGGTRVNKDGLIETVEETLSGELITNGDFDTDTWWLKSSANVNISNGKGNYTAGTPVEYFYKLNVLTVGKEYKLTYEITDYTTGYITGYGGNWSIVAEDVGVQEVYFTANDAGFGLVGYNFIGSIDNVSVIEINQDNLARIDYTDGTEGVLLTEPQSTNTALYSSEASNAWWFKANVTITANQGISPDGTNNAELLEATSGNGVIYRTGVTTGSLSFFAKIVNIGNAKFRISVDNVGSASWNGDGTLNTVSGGTATSGISYGNGWYRFTLNVTSGTVLNYGLTNATSGDSILIYGMQNEASLSYSTSYMPTYGQIASRAADVVNNGGDVNNFNSEEGVLYFEIAALANEAVNKRISISDGTDANRMTININSDQISGFINVNNVTQYTFFEASQSVLDFNKIAIKYKENSFGFWINGVQYDVSTSGTTFPSSTLTTLSLESGYGGNHFYGKTKNLQVFNEALTDEELYNLTSDRYATYDIMATDLTFDKQ